MVIYKPLNLTTSGSTANSSVWCRWNKDYTSTAAYWFDGASSSATTTGDYIVWRKWNDDYTNTASWVTDTTEDPFWMHRTGISNGSGIVQIWQDWNVDQEARSASKRATAEQREAWQRMEAEQRRLQEEQRARQREEAERYRAENEARWKKEAEERVHADKRAEELLRSCLTPEQQDELERLNHFHLIVGEKKYRIKRGRSRNIELLDATGRPIEKLCAHPRDYVPDADTMLAQKLMLETDEAAFLKLANHTPVHYPPEPPTVYPEDRRVTRAV